MPVRRGKVHDPQKAAPELSIDVVQAARQYDYVAGMLREKEQELLEAVHAMRRPPVSLKLRELAPLLHVSVAFISGVMAGNRRFSPALAARVLDSIVPREIYEKD